MPTGDIHEKFLNLHMPVQRQILGYLITAVRDFHTAEDLWQDITIAAWKRFSSYDSARPYLPWLFGITRNLLAKHFRGRSAETSHLPLEVVEDVVAIMAEQEDSMARERDALQRCLERLAPKHRELIKNRYEGRQSLKALASRLGKTIGGVNMLLFRIRKKLLDCTGRVLSSEELS